MTDRKIQLDFEPTRTRLLELADAEPSKRAQCSYTVCIAGRLLAEKMTGAQWDELIRDHSSTAIDSIIGDEDAPETFQIVTDSQDTVNLLTHAQGIQDGGAPWGEVAKWIRKTYPDKET